MSGIAGSALIEQVRLATMDVAEDVVGPPALVTRETSSSEYRQAADALCVSYLREPPTDERWEKSLPSWNNMISFSSWDGDRCVGHAGYHITETTVPGGGRLETAAVTRVGVVPTHSRMGAGSDLMDAVIGDALERDLPLASLRASEAVIYRRYGFGVAGDFCAIAVDPVRARPVLSTPPSNSGRFRQLAADEIEPVTAELDMRALGSRPGLMTRLDPWRRWHFGDAIDQSKGAFVVVHLDSDEQPDGYVHYHCNWNDVFNTGGDGEIKDVVAVSDDVELSLWAYLFDIDLIRSWNATQRPVDDLIREAVRDRRAYRITAVNDEQWVRLLDVDLALSTRAYNPITKSIVIEVNDPVVIANNGRWRVGSDRVERTDDAPDIEADIDAVSAMYLGAGSWHAEAAVGRARIPGSSTDKFTVLGWADQLFSHKPLPFCGTFF